MYNTRKDTEKLADEQLGAAWSQALKDGSCNDHSGAMLEEEIRDRWLKEKGFKSNQETT